MTAAASFPSNLFSLFFWNHSFIWLFQLSTGSSKLKTIFPGFLCSHMTKLWPVSCEQKLCTISRSSLPFSPFLQPAAREVGLLLSRSELRDTLRNMEQQTPDTQIWTHNQSCGQICYTSSDFYVRENKLLSCLNCYCEFSATYSLT